MRPPERIATRSATPRPASKLCVATTSVPPRDLKEGRGGPQKRGEDSRGRGLAGAVRPQEGQALAGGDLERDIVEDRRWAVDLAEVPGLDHEVGSGERGRRAARRPRSRRDQSL